MIIDRAIYRDGRRIPVPGDLADALRGLRAADEGFLWVGLADPTEDEVAWLASRFALHPLAAEDAQQPHQRPKMEEYSDVLVTVVRPLSYDREQAVVTSSEVVVFVGDSFVVAVRHGDTRVLAGVRSRLQEAGGLARHGPVTVLYAICDAVVDDYLDIAANLQVDLEELQGQVFSSARGDDARLSETIYSFKRQVLEIRRATGPLTGPMARLSDSGVPFVPADSSAYFRSVAGHLARADGVAENLDGLLSDILTAHLTQVGVQQNDDMRKISAWAAMAAVPTLIAGVYGMNFDHMPELHQIWGYPAALGLMAVVVLGLYVLFKRRHWL
ncbi:magnesium and cobalt transport protein CorA [Actinacidiphila bryophytorum]|uniref:Magnesium transport protein CorA n=1 Tax=Actinacidiphila bryophytorum TaxID=1436133 RepID=A0A9W4E482_9ACTN|nr:magnesium and cobalt transport protein CorA [Actinacidiphila bryophytorum]MBM9438009.1 magnesium and cobalt transport protein CorA [Actinacidiphila bryophytorum]MBN6541688.1 magnesium and cobalt transport protein CorA [Actinacidiphila bryophytorum]CAG7617843.1 Magnesium transport protein CorA [Actinacidiphila bryophytorum]